LENYCIDQPDYLGVLTEYPCTNPHTHLKIPQKFRGVMGYSKGQDSLKFCTWAFWKLCLET
jgi:hypothetical protein